MSVQGAVRPLRVGLLWHSANSGNLGVGALTVANLAIARQAAQAVGREVEFLIIGMGDTGPRYVDEADARVLRVDMKTLLSPAGCWAAFGKLDAILDIGAGDSFADIYGPKRFGFMWLTKMIALARRTPLVLSPQTIGPFTREPYVSLARMPLKGARVVVARDDVSFDFLGQIAPSANRLKAIDVAFALPFENQRRAPGGGPARVGVNVSGLLFNEAEAGTNRFKLDVDYAALMRRFIAGMLARGDVEVHLLTHANGLGADDDRQVADRLLAEFPAAVRVSNFRGPSEAKTYISSLDFLVSGRMHACIGAYSSGTPVVPVAYSRKFSGLFGTLGYPWMVPVNGMSTDEALAYLNDCFEKRAQLGQDEASGMRKVDGLLETYRQELRELFRGIGQGAA